MILRDLTDRARDEGTRAIRGIVDGARGRFSNRSSSDLYVVHGAAERRDDEPVWWSRTDPETDGTPAPPDADDAEIAGALARVAETIDRLAAQLDAHHTERAAQLDAIEFLLREVVLGGAGGRPSSVGAGGEPDPIGAVDHTISLVPGGPLLEVDTPVEVRSRFHDRWICGFAVAEVIDDRAGRSRYRLTRRSDGIPLPLLFEACDVRAGALLPERQPAVD
jgi:hypothetical protein